MRLSIFFLILFLTPRGPLLAQAIEHVSPGEVQNKVQESDDISDEDRWASQTFIHQGYIDRQMDEACQKLKDHKACRGRGRTKFLGMDSANVEVLAKAYTMVIGMTPLGGSFQKRSGKSLFQSMKDKSNGVNDASASTEQSANQDTEQSSKDNQSENKDKEDDKQDDYCRYVAFAGEMSAALIQQLQQNSLSNIPIVESVQQKGTLYKAAQSHNTRSKVSKTQAITWGATTACYSFLALNNVVFDWNIGLKLASSALLTKFYLGLYEDHKKYAKDVKSIADRLPGPGDCNPITDKLCYCAQEETKYDPKHCLHNNVAELDLAANVDPVVCIDSNFKDDPKCNCIAQDNCVDKVLFSEIGGSKIGQSFLKSPVAKDIKNLSQGKLSAGSLGRAVKIGNQATGRLRKKKANTSNVSLNRSQRKVSDHLEALGFGKAVAKKFAMAAPGPGMSQNLNKFKNGMASLRGTQKSGRRAKRNKNRVLTFKNSDGLSQKRGRKKGDSQLDRYLKGLRKKKTSPSKNNKILTFMDKAAQRAQITKETERPLFEIISKRYQTSAWKRLEIK